MQVKVMLFAGLRELLGSELVEGFEGDEVSVSEFRLRLGERYPQLGPHLECAAIAVNEEYVRDGSAAIHAGDVVALIPPVSGGSGETPHFLVTADPLDRDALRELVRTDEAGAVVLFEGIVRNHHQGHAVLRLEYEAYPSMAEKQLAAVAREVLEEFGEREVYDLAAHHRTGTIEIGEASLLVAVSAAHRRDAFEAALRAVDRIKETVPVWKKEYGPEGAVWQEGVEPSPSATGTAQRL
ncbi:MAG: molybdenum cofactor biosynthesis protein MoaE [Dehalococcoidia bacterium]|nr:molybdenum cofactor biosynthesis protein MoaE [Dehalococcoidia bacterium]